MKRKKVLHIVLTVIGTGALMAYLIACSPAWSPDGSQILFPYGDYYGNFEEKRSGIAMYDKNTGKTTSIWTNSEKGAPLWAQWDSTGKKAILITPTLGHEDDGAIMVQVLRIGAKEPDHTFGVLLPKARLFPLDDPRLRSTPLPEADGSLFAAGDSLVRMDLTTGEVERRKIPEDLGPVFLVGNGNRIYYVALTKKQECHIGTLDPKKLSLSPMLELPPKDVGIFSSDWVAVAKDGSAIAILAYRAGGLGLLLIAGGRVQKSIPLMRLPKNEDPVSLLGGRPGNLQWAPDGKIIYVSVVSGERQPPLKHFFVEITVDTGAIRQTPIVMPKYQGDDSRLWIALSPDGKTIAAMSMHILGGNHADLALHLVDLTDPDRKVTKIPPPGPQDPKN